MNKILILGAGSFAGSSLVDFLLKKKLKIIGINRTIYKKKYFFQLKKIMTKLKIYYYIKLTLITKKI